MAEKKKKKETFGQAFKRNRKKFMDSGKANDYTFKYEGKDYNVRQKGETEKGLLAKYVKSAPKKSVRPKTRPSAGISANTKKKIEETVKKVATPSATTSKDKGSSYAERQTQLRIQEDKKDKAAAAKRKAIRRSSAASKTLGTDPAPRKESGPMSARAVQRKSATQKARLGPVIRGDGPMSARAVQRKANSDKVRAGQAALDKDRAGPQRPAKLSERNLRKFMTDPSSLTKIQKDRLFKSLRSQGKRIPKGLSADNR